jgi:hypothetical protein
MSELKDLKINWWLSAALDDPCICNEFKQDIALWLNKCEDKSIVDTKFLEEMKDSHAQLSHLESLGVDNWGGYSHYSWDEDD